jgi:hypothetical protein
MLGQKAQYSNMPFNEVKKGGDSMKWYKIPGKGNSDKIKICSDKKYQKMLNHLKGL